MGGLTCMLAAAAQVLRLHTADRAGWCRGCSALWGRLVSVDQCTQVAWARAVARHGSPVRTRGAMMGG